MSFPKHSIFFILALLCAFSCKKDETDLSEELSYHCLQNPTEQGDYDVYGINIDLSPFKFEPNQRFSFDLDCNGQDDFSFDSYIQMFLPASGWTYNNLTPLHDDASIYVNQTIDTTYFYHDTIIENEGSSTFYRYFDITTCTKPSSSFTILETKTNYSLPIYTDLDEPSGGIWSHTSVNVKSSSTHRFTALDDTSSVDTTYYWYTENHQQCYNFPSQQDVYIHLKVDRFHGPLFAYVKMNSSFYIEHIGVLRQ